VTAAPKVLYRVRDLDAARSFYAETLGFNVTFLDPDEGWVGLEHGDMQIALTEGEPDSDGGVATIDVSDVKAEAERLRQAGVTVGVVLELHGQMRLLDIYDPDGNRVQLAQLLDEQ
jgi:catechol 2,3-dioxygenase-like lactoylglutathione lyase family enzyme